MHQKKPKLLPGQRKSDYVDATTRLRGQVKILNWRVLLLHESWSDSFGTSCARKRQNWLPTEIAYQSKTILKH
uniref:Uncharacterized protein n=1 Tax=Candidatus Kentrum sp. TC TaxID=2126339 RepID=A0A451ADY5_9GAMM|nr:MAG: hypothetical protein BECKTC1821F_GA0114240_100694 [Candidatus Kentron sp. TC]VFK64242.1 MAG: hypothetical protein BECKTC1821F_GA0114240_11189 [Candidatus Kentron sp. TC]